MLDQLDWDFVLEHDNAAAAARKRLCDIRFGYGAVGAGVNEDSILARGGVDKNGSNAGADAATYGPDTADVDAVLRQEGLDVIAKRVGAHAAHKAHGGGSTVRAQLCARQRLVRALAAIVRFKVGGGYRLTGLGDTGRRGNYVVVERADHGNGIGSHAEKGGCVEGKGKGQL